MTQYRYTAQKMGGETYTGAAEAPDRFALYEMIRREGGKVVSVEEDSTSKKLSFAYWNAKIATVPEREKILFARNLAAMLKAGLALSRALSVIERQTRQAKFASVLAQIGSEVRRGTSFHDALAQYPHVFSRIFIAMVKAGEESGNLPGSLVTISDQMNESYTLKKKVRSAMIYPTIIIVAIIGIGAVLLTTVVPTLAETFKELGAQLPATTQFVINLSDFLVENTLLALAIAIIVIVGFMAGLRTTIGKRLSAQVAVHMPLIGPVVKEVNAARTARTLGSLLHSSVDMLAALEITTEVVQNPLFQDVLREAHEAVAKGDQLPAVFMRHENLYPPLVGEMLSVGVETGQLSEMLTRLAEIYEESVSTTTKDMSTIIEPFLMLIIGSAVGFFAVAMISPIYSLSSAI
ncbi:MAG TPA: type II secretion system F family protein [Candidatus Paceibacterota bacterium]|nr:type II secretion system F family protein [Candidatus Paceibacterota bacterium]